METRESERILRLLAERVPEIESGLVDVKAIARIPGIRSKVAIQSRSPNIDAMDVCVGAGGCRLHQIIDELGGERVELVRWHDTPERLIINAIQPAKIDRVQLDRVQHRATVVVKQDQLRLVAGERGSQNRDLASQLTGWQIEVVAYESTGT